MPTSARLVLCLGLLCSLALAAPARAGCPNAPLQFARAAFSGNSDAVEHVTIRARSGAHDTFIRFSMTNAVFKRGELFIAFRQETAGGTLYGEQAFARGDYTVATDKLGIRAGKHSLEVANGQLVAAFDFGTLQASVALTSHAGGLQVADRSNGMVLRELLVPTGRLLVKARNTAGLTADVSAAAFAMHDASTAPPHQIYDRAVQLHHPVAGGFLLVDYVVLTAARGGKPLGWMVATAGGKTFVGEVVREARSDERVDSRNSYAVPYQVAVLGKRGEARAAVKLTADKQVAREDDLADMNYVLRKAVGALMHPVTYTLKAKADVEIQPVPAEPALVSNTSIRFKYSQVR